MPAGTKKADGRQFTALFNKDITMQSGDLFSPTENTIVAPLILSVCDIILHHRVTHLHSCLVASLSCKN